MTTNSKNRLHKIFFYGLYMDPDILRSRDVIPRDPMIGYVQDYKLQIGKNSALLRSFGSKAYGIVYALTHSEIYALYHGCGLHQYAPEVVSVIVEGKEIPVLCYNLITLPTTVESNIEYEESLNKAKKKLGVLTGEQ